MEERTRWLQRHEQETSGVMALFPLVVGLPLRVTVTDVRLKPARVFNNSRGTLEGWALAPEDAAAVHECVVSELVCNVYRCASMCAYQAPVTRAMNKQSRRSCLFSPKP